MNTPKLPPLPEPDMYADPCDANGMQTEYYTEATVMRLLAAIAAQGVPDVDDLRDRLVAISSAVAHSDDREAQAIIRTTLECLASAPPAPQADDGWRKYATEREETAQAVIERHRKEHESLLRLLAKDRKTIAELKAAVVQQEPVGYVPISAIEEGPLEGYVAVYAHPAQQAKPDRTGMTYYKKDGCKAPSADHPDCICWTQAPQSWPFPGWEVQKEQGNDCEHKWAMDDDHPAHSCCQRCGKVREPQAAVVQQEPVACIQHFKGDKGRLFFYNEVSPPPGSGAYVDEITWTLLYNHPAQQAKPQPLSDEQVDRLYEAAVKARKFVTRQDFELGIRAAEAAHGIKE